MIICINSPAAESSAMAAQRRHSQSTDNFPLGTPAQWITEGHVTCNIQCSARNCDRRMVDVRLDTLPQDLPWSTIGRRLVCKECGAAGSVNFVANWHDTTAVPLPSRMIPRQTPLRKLSM